MTHMTHVRPPAHCAKARLTWDRDRQPLLLPLGVAVAEAASTQGPLGVG